MERHGALVLRLALGTMFLAHAALAGGLLILAAYAFLTAAALAQAFVGDGSFALAGWLRARKLRQQEAYA